MPSRAMPAMLVAHWRGLISLETRLMFVPCSQPYGPPGRASRGATVVLFGNGCGCFWETQGREGLEAHLIGLVGSRKEGKFSPFRLLGKLNDLPNLGSPPSRRCGKRAFLRRKILKLPLAGTYWCTLVPPGSPHAAQSSDKWQGSLATALRLPPALRAVQHTRSMQ
jgi:hypothetical protein